MRACWSARDAEVKGIGKRLIYKEQDLEHKQKELSSFKRGSLFTTLKLETATNDIDNLNSQNKTHQEELTAMINNCESLEKFNKELLESQSNLQEDITNYERLNELKEAEYIELKEKYVVKKLKQSLN